MTLGHHVTEIMRAGIHGVEDAGEIACRVLVWFERFLIGVLCCRVRFAVIKILFADHLELVERHELGGSASSTHDREGCVESSDCSGYR